MTPMFLSDKIIEHPTIGKEKPTMGSSAYAVLFTQTGLHFLSVFMHNFISNGIKLMVLEFYLLSISYKGAPSSLSRIHPSSAPRG